MGLPCGRALHRYGIGEGTQVGGVLYRVDGGTWQPLDHPTTINGKGKVVHVEIVTNDRPGNYNDNTGAMSLTLVRTKA